LEVLNKIFNKEFNLEIEVIDEKESYELKRKL